MLMQAAAEADLEAMVEDMEGMMPMTARALSREQGCCGWCCCSCCARWVLCSCTGLISMATLHQALVGAYVP